MGLTFLIPTKHKIVMPKGMKYMQSPLFILCYNIVHEENTGTQVLKEHSHRAFSLNNNSSS